MWDVLPRAGALDGMTAVAADSVAKFRGLIEHFQKRLQHDSLTEVVSALITKIGYQDEITRVHKDAQEQQARWAAVESVVNTLSAYEQRNKRGTLADFLDEIALGDRILTQRDWPGRAPRSLLLLLLGTPGHRLPRDRVLDTLWPEADPDGASNALYKALHAARRVLEPGLRAAKNSVYLQIGGDALVQCVDGQPARSDQHVLQRRFPAWLPPEEGS